ncbi:MAG: TIGR02530 family flagellar biosynthesis protein [Sarcina sp.]
MNYKIINGRPYYLGLENPLQNSNKRENIKKNNDFKTLLNEQLREKKQYSFKFSNHAKERIEFLNLNDNDYRKIENGIKKAREKASKNTVIFYREMAFLVSVENNTVITVVEKERAKDNIFTNIDSVVMVE